MSKAKGFPNYTQRSIAFPTLSMERGVIDEVNVEFDASRTQDSGCYGSGVVFEFHDLGGHGTGLQVSGWDDGFQNLMDDRIQAVLADLRKLRQRRNSKSRFGHAQDAATPAEVIRLLEKHGISPSKYQTEAMANR